MGIPEDLFVEPPDAQLICSVCLDIMDDPVITPCVHSFCRICADKAIQVGKSCPNCRSKVTSLVSSPALSQKVDDLIVYCDIDRRYRCDWTGKHSEYNIHKKTCTKEQRRRQTIMRERIKQIFEMTPEELSALPIKTLVAFLKVNKSKIPTIGGSQGIKRQQLAKHVYELSCQIEEKERKKAEKMSIKDLYVVLQKRGLSFSPVQKPDKNALVQTYMESRHLDSKLPPVSESLSSVKSEHKKKSKNGCVLM